jgi:hypothetical protein
MSRSCMTEMITNEFSTFQIQTITYQYIYFLRSFPEFQ